MYEYRARVLRIVDADTIDVEIDLGFRVKTDQRLRLARIDAWETRGEEREDGLAAKEFLMEFLANHAGRDYVVLRTNKDKQGKYGRYIAEILVMVDGEEVNVNDKLVKEGHAVLYGEK